ncbi:MAG: hypothetical protein CVU84_10220 [Firmicutes bacterium HGW-Firmicutes-1]|jgi:putative membrane protein|nr:MAG: hypothetical protein CVU84_10220 [Firmicutes bacterium HGW-Firmicutes-1]
MFFVPLLLITLLVLAGVFIFRIGTINTSNTSGYTNQITNNSNDNKPIEFLKERYAKGEITEDEYMRIKRNLEG